MRPSSPALAAAFAAGAADAGADVVMIGLASTDQLYFASGHLGHPGAMFTASHNPAQYNGIKLCRAGAAAGRRRDRAARDPRRRRRRRGARGGEHAGHDLAARRARGVRRAPARAGAGHRPPAQGRRRRRQRDGRADRAGGLRAASATASSWCRCTSSSTAPSRTTRPTRSSRRTSSTSRSGCVAESADLGLAFDGDADRCFVVDERGRAVSPSTLTALIAARELAKEPGATVIHNLITSRRVPELVTELGGTPVRTRVGHSFIKATMAETDAVFGGEHSGHFYFRDFWRADSGMLAALHTLAALAETDRPLSELLDDYQRYVAQRGDQLRRSPTRRRCTRPSRRRTPRRAGADDRPPRRAHRHHRRLVVQRARRPTPSRCCASTSRARDDDDHGPRPRRRPRHDQEAEPMNLDPTLLEIIRCPD